MESGIYDKEQAQRHDEGYKGILSNRDSFLHFLKKYIGAPWADDISVDGLERVDTSFVTGEYKLIDSDIIYKLKMNDADVYFYVLLELQSKVDFTMPFRLLRYMVELLHYIFKNTDEKTRTRKDFRLPAIVPIILYNGDDSWTAARSYREYTENQEIFGGSIIDFSYLLFDLKRSGEEETILSTRRMLDIIFILDRSRSKNLAEELERLIDVISELNDDDISALIGWITYAHFKGKVTPDYKNELKQILKKGDAKTMKHSMEVFMDEQIEKWKNEGREEGWKGGREEGWKGGREEGWKGGREEGWKDGLKEATRKNAKAMKGEGIDMGTIARITGLTAEEISRL